MHKGHHMTGDKRSPRMTEANPTRSSPSLQGELSIISSGCARRKPSPLGPNIRPMLRDTHDWAIFSIMRPQLYPWQLLSVIVAGIFNEQQQHVIDYLKEENRILREQLGKLGHRVARTTVANILSENGLEPAPNRSKRSTWAEFLKMHRESIAAVDFFTIEAWTANTLPCALCHRSTDAAS
jgi:hypothetical protein